ncbi:hypothetical protein [Chitinophaga sp. S165]|uniref:hypothetical protein n=1 Tax=Chitinophaga sp. S165 TaxID=2135462 RepID=UPI000D70C783|nr:hypothetical protein [Chitinophaga sp. S165]PWV51614.1 hypothetical protein C7475_103224 [Chitinophaga sp. S165]
MPVNFFDAHHTRSDQTEFGLYDEPDPAKKPAYILEGDKPKWIGIVKNPNRFQVDFYGLDHDPATTIYKNPPTNTERESMCDGLVKQQDELIFVELKTRKGPGWLADATDQLINSINLFARDHVRSIHAFSSVRANICNSLRPNFSQNYMKEMQRFKDETAGINFKGKRVGLEMTVKQEIEI